MRQRAMIAMALLYTPQLVIMDEPTSALDVVAQQSLMSKIKELQRNLGFAVIFVTHDMSVVSRYSDRVLVMYAGQVAEAASTEAIFDRPLHPYTRGLMNAFPSLTRPAPRTDRDPWQPAGPGSPAERLSVPSALPRRHAGLPRARARALCGRRYRGSLPPLHRTGRASRADCLSHGRDARPHRARPPRPGEPLLRTVDLTRHFRLGGTVLTRSALHAVDDLNIKHPESARSSPSSAKAAAARAPWLDCWRASISRPAARSTTEAGRSGRLRSRKDFLWYRGEVPIVLQDPFSAFHPVFRVSHGVMRNLALHRPELSGDERRAGGRACLRGGRTEPQDARPDSRMR